MNTTPEKQICEVCGADKNEDPHSTPEYAAFVAESCKHCHCREDIRPCDSVLAGGICDGVTEEEPERDGVYEDQDENWDEENPH